MAAFRGWEPALVLSRENAATGHRTVGDRPLTRFEASSTGDLAAPGQSCPSKLGAGVLAPGQSALRL